MRERAIGDHHGVWERSLTVVAPLSPTHRAMCGERSRTTVGRVQPAFPPNEGDTPENMGNRPSARNVGEVSGGEVSVSSLYPMSALRIPGGLAIIGASAAALLSPMSKPVRTRRSAEETGRPPPNARQGASSPPRRPPRSPTASIAACALTDGAACNGRVRARQSLHEHRRETGRH